MEAVGPSGDVPPEVVDYYEGADEPSRLSAGLGLVEFDRTRRLVKRRLPSPPGVVVDAGCGGGAYGLWLADLGYEVHVSDPVSGHVDAARAAARLRGVEFASASVGHAADLANDDATVDVVLSLGPLYHLQERAARLAVIEEAVRVLRPGGYFFGAAISRFTAMVNAIRDDGLLSDDGFFEIVLGDLSSGRHVNTTGDSAFFTTAFVHDPADLAMELVAGGLVEVEVVAIEGLAWAIDDVEALQEDIEAWRRLMTLLELTEREPSILGASTHLLGIGRHPEAR